MKTLTTIIPSVFNQLNQGSQFISVMGYINNYGERSNFGLVFHVDYMKAVKKAVNLWWAYNPKTHLEKQARVELINSYVDTLRGFSHSTSAHAYDRICDANGKLVKGVKWWRRGEEVHLWGFVVNKLILDDAEYPEDNRLPLTLSKQKLLRMTSIGRFRQYKLINGRFNHIGVEGLSLTQKDLIKQASL